MEFGATSEHLGTIYTSSPSLELIGANSHPSKKKLVPQINRVTKGCTSRGGEETYHQRAGVLTDVPSTACSEAAGTHNCAADRTRATEGIDR